MLSVRRLALLVLPCLALAVPTAARASVTLGTQTDTLSAFSTVAIAGGTVIATLDDPRPGYHVTAPADGVITSWRTNEFSGSATAALVVLQRSGGTDDLRMVSSGPPATASGNPWFGASIRVPIKAGQQVGVVLLSQSFSYFFWGQDVTGGRYAYYNNLVPGGPAQSPKSDGGSPASPMVTTDAVFNVQAVVEPDADGDGYGDETQDRCPGVANQDQADADGDGLGNVCDADDDNDGLADADEATASTDPLVADSDGDGLADGDEVTRGTDPLQADSDADGLDDANEVARGTDPLQADTDADGLSDGDEIALGTNPLRADSDGDGVSDADEGAHGTDPLRADTDADGLPDGDEITRGTDPLQADTDGDGLDDHTEIALGLDPRSADSDGDTFGDGVDRCPTVAGTDHGCAAAPAPAPPAARDEAPAVTFAAPADHTSVDGGATVDAVLTATDDHGVASVDVLYRGTVLCHLTTAPYTCAFPASGDLVGQGTLVAVARDAAGQIGTATTTLVVQRFVPDAIDLTATVKHRTATTVTARGAVARPAGLDAAAGCAGRVTVRVKRKSVTISSRRVTLSRTCRFVSTVAFGSRIHAGDRLQVRATFEGNPAMGRRISRTQTVTVKAGGHAASARRPAHAGRQIVLHG